MKLPKYFGKKKIKSDRGGNVRLPQLSNNSAYLKHPGEGMGMRPPKAKRKLAGGGPVAKMCGLCGTKHAPGEPHKAMNASFFQGKPGKKRIIGGYIAPNMAKRRKSNMGGISARSQSQNNPSIR